MNTTEQSQSTTRVYLVTGATGVIGKAIAHQLAATDHAMHKGLIH